MMLDRQCTDCVIAPTPCSLLWICIVCDLTMPHGKDSCEGGFVESKEGDRCS